MDLLHTLLIFLSFAVCLFFVYARYPNSGHRGLSKLPPGPKPFPIIGNILELGKKPHQSLAKLSKTYGPLMHLKLGSVTTIVVSSPEIAKIVLQKYDQFFCNRSSPQVVQVLDHQKYSVAWMSVNNDWRKLRKLCKEQMFSAQRLDASQGLRMENLRKLLDHVNECCLRREPVAIGSAAYTMSINLIWTTLFSQDFAAGHNSSQEIKDVVQGMSELMGKPNLSDYFPLLQMVDPQGMYQGIKIYYEKLFEIFDEVINLRMTSSDSSSKNDMLEALLHLNKESELSIDAIKHFLADLFTAGVDTSSGTVEWAMTELVRNPEKMLKAKTEIRSMIPQNEQVQESDLSRFPYLNAVIKETFRLHPNVPFLIPRKAEEDVEVNGHLVPKNSQILVNVWAIGRDSSIWSNSDLFMPERFLKQEIDFQGRHFELIPFGAGRRMCPGLPLGNRMVQLMLATLIHNFDWEVEQGLQPEEVDMTEKYGITLEKAIPLKIVPYKV